MNVWYMNVWGISATRTHPSATVEWRSWLLDGVYTKELCENVES